MADGQAALAHHGAGHAIVKAAFAGDPAGGQQAQGHAAEDIERLAAHRSFPGDRPSTTILYRRLDPFALGRLIALYEHKVFVQAAVWNVNAFDQWGVELGKVLTKGILDGEISGYDASTRALLARTGLVKD